MKSVIVKFLKAVLLGIMSWLIPLSLISFLGYVLSYFTLPAPVAPSVVSSWGFWLLVSGISFVLVTLLCYLESKKAKDKSSWWMIIVGWATLSGIWISLWQWSVIFNEGMSQSGM